MTRIRKARRCLSFVALCALAGAGCGDAHVNASSSGARLRKVRMAFSPFVSWGPLMIAEAEGFFRAEGLDVEFVSALHSEESVVALATGDLDVRPGPLSAGLLSAVAQGAPIRVTAGMGYLARDGCTYFGIVLRHGMDPAHAVPRRMRAAQDGYSRFLVSRMLALRKVSMAAIETVRLPGPVMASSLDSGAIDAVATSEPTLSRVAAVGTRWISAQDAAPDFQWGVIAFGDRFLSRDRDTGLRFMRAYRRGIAQYAQGKTARNVEIIAKDTDDTPEAARAICWPAFRPDARIDWNSIAAFNRWAQDEKLMERTLTEREIWDPTFVIATGSETVDKP